MTIATIDRAQTAVPTQLARGRGGGGPATKRTVVAYGFWIFILSDMVMFSALFAAYAVLRRNTAGGPTGADLFNLRNVFIEATEFAAMVENGAGPSRSGFLSAFFTLVGMHGVHVASGLIALVYLTAQAIAKGLRATVLRRLLCWSLFWHALDIVWVGVFTLVYLMGDY